MNERQILRLKQSTESDCYPTAIAMLTGVNKDTIMKLLGPNKVNKEGFFTSELAFAMLKLGWALISIDVFEMGTKLKKVFAFLEKEHIGTILTVKKNEKSKFHTLVWDGASKIVLDPTSGLVENIDDIDPVYSIDILLKISDEKIKLIAKRFSIIT